MESFGGDLRFMSPGSASAYETSRCGIFAVGDVRAGSVKRVASSVGERSVVVGEIWSRLNLPEAA